MKYDQKLFQSSQNLKGRHKAEPKEQVLEQMDIILSMVECTDYVGKRNKLDEHVPPHDAKNASQLNKIRGTLNA